ncbi:energy transducer TonB [Acidithiobacillus sp. VAN18-1]|uniref:Energy transducer TonB n=2 Tax=Igneacidithiobacillus copahuensis TaxID=2724909 RepID=A0AAE2YME3_9PROT|nr:energy transducer TonB [Igneacidithiobacillus copahuensis]MBU2797753.1 energy transducer TonB [Acidithiobacillus sp. VAN18-2]
MGDVSPAKDSEKPSRWSYQGKTNSFRYAIIGALAVELALVAGLIFFPHSQPAKKKPPEVISVKMVHLPPPPPPPKPKVKPIPHPPKPVKLPVPVVHRPAPLPVKPPSPPTPPPPKPVVKVPPPVKTPPPPPPPPPAPVYSGVGAYGDGARSVVRGNVHVSAIIKRLGLTGTVVIGFKLAPSGGKAYDVHVVSGSDNPLLRKAAIKAVQDSTFPPFTSHMPPRALSFTVPIDIS